MPGTGSLLPRPSVLLGDQRQPASIAGLEGIKNFNIQQRVLKSRYPKTSGTAVPLQFSGSRAPVLGGRGRVGQEEQTWRGHRWC